VTSDDHVAPKLITILQAIGTVIHRITNLVAVMNP